MNLKNIKTLLSFDDVLLAPQYSDIVSRKEVDLSSELSPGITLRVPIIASPMDTICESGMASKMADFGGIGVIHRYNTVETQSAMVAKVRSESSEQRPVGAAVATTGDYLIRAKALIDAGASVLCVDVAHGDHCLMRAALMNLKEKYGHKCHIMAGNVATYEAARRLSSWGADSIRVGIGGGSICSTRIQTGHGIPTFASIVECAKVKDSFPNVKIIADGGIKNSGDMVKAYAAGADFVMVGSLLAGTRQTPGEVVYKDGERFKTYRGMASSAAQMDWRGKVSSLEGISTVVPLKGDVNDILDSLERGIRSGLSYSGARTFKDLQEDVIFVRQTSGGAAESSTHILRRN